MKKKKSSGSKSHFSTLRKIQIALALIAIGTAVFMALCPNAFHVVRYYAYETRDTVAGWFGLLPEYDNLALGAPVGGKIDRVFQREGYAYGYSEEYEQPLWVTYKLTYGELQNKKFSRSDDFREDPRILTRSASPADYKSSGYDCGHLAPAADMGWSSDVMSASFFMSNMTPQKPEFNRGIWKRLEDLVRDFARKEETVFIVTGPVFYPGRELDRIGENRVAVPHACYKVVYDMTPPEKMIGFILPNEKAPKKKKLQDYAVTVKAVEQATGLEFFPALPENVREKLKTTITVSDWQWEKKSEPKSPAKQSGRK